MLDVKTHLDEIRSRETKRPKKANILIYSRPGAGKTWALRSCPGPILIHSFDPGGTRGLSDLIDSGQVIVDSRFESENPTKPSVYKLWEAEFNKLNANKVFEGISAYVIDSGTMWQQTVLNEIAKQANRAGQTFQLQDYGRQQQFIQQCLLEITSIPCHFIMTGHIETRQDEVDGRIYTSLMASGKLKNKIPMMFDEYWLLEVEETRSGLQRFFKTQISGKRDARSRHNLPDRIPADLSEALKLSGYTEEKSND